jgi:hypothetical protein
MINYIKKFIYKQAQIWLQLKKHTYLNKRAYFERISYKDEAWPPIPPMAQNIPSYKNIAASKFS